MLSRHLMLPKENQHQLTSQLLKTNWFMYYEGLLWGAAQSHIHVQNLVDGYDPNP